MTKFRLKYLTGDVDRHGNARWYVRVPGRPKVRIRAPFGSAEFLTAYRGALSTDAPPRRIVRGAKPKPNTLRWLVLEYFQSAAFKQLNARTRYVRRRELEKVCEMAGDEL